jgi:hypothetical protein
MRDPVSSHDADSNLKRRLLRPRHINGAYLGSRLSS